jgi:hypothetical protein
MTVKETYQYLIQKYDLKEFDALGTAVPKSNQIQFSGYLISLDDNNIKVAQDIDYEQAHIYFCYSYTYKPDDVAIIEKQMEYVIERVNHKEKILKQLNNDKQIEELNKDFS